LFIDIEDLVVHAIHSVAANVDRRRLTGVPAASSLWTGRKVDAELSQEPYNPIRGWRWT